MSSEALPLIAPSKADRLHETIFDASTGAPGIVANELAHDPEFVPEIEQDTHPHGYGSTIDPTATQDEDADYALPPRELYLVFSSLFMGIFLAALDGTVVTTLLTVISSDLNAVSNISWIATAYLLSCAAFQPLFGKLSDIFGRKCLIILCNICFAIGCLMSTTDNVWTLVFARLVTGIGGGGMTSLATITMSDLVSLRKRGLYQGIGNLFFGLGAASGGVMGGIVADILGWRAVFLLQAPIAIISAAFVYKYLNLPEGSPGLGYHGSDMMTKFRCVDFLGSSLLVLSVGGIMAAASLGGKEFAYNSYPFVALLATSVLFLLAFVYVELYVSPEPTIPVRLLADRTVLCSSLANWFFTMACYVGLYYVPIFFTSVLGNTPTQNGLRLIPNTIAASAGSLISGIYMKKTGRYYRYIVVTSSFSVFGFFFLTQMTPTMSNFKQFTVLLLPTFGYSSVVTVTLLALIAAVPASHQAATTSIQYAFRSTGSTLGVSIASAIFQHLLKARILINFDNLLRENPKLAEKYNIGEIISKSLDNTDYIYEAPKVFRTAIRMAYSSGCHGAFYFAFGTVILGYLSCIGMREHTLHTSIKRK
ncbi:hypothetical protein BABINDRAFT_160933 [Babjeviella inositovora NRRL Y-12698]|uniref:Major facilitator superfamily (MFS) profile domain-containing protein n=1 Tax=Babjeviella inositovora NRRL Y-12698 TaxID=984486 RepID=A0A1E3QSQ5_9ASCO|nr:uncharacterized protein BABINDRAFT_160933 [Babjeviella inositovora NRRL Y-12698]ODQ80700.1 hypothetical protein BABINDRAFT_160933 [Babjeviella inositovora NRRL Y-12698]